MLNPNTSDKEVKKFIRLEGSETRLEEVARPEVAKNRQMYFGEAIEVGFTIALPLVAGALFGLWLDKKWATQPTFTLIGLFAGIVIAFGNLFVIVSKFSRKS